MPVELFYRVATHPLTASEGLYQQILKRLLPEVLQQEVEGLQLEVRPILGGLH